MPRPRIQYVATAQAGPRPRSQSRSRSSVRATVTATVNLYQYVNQGHGKGPLTVTVTGTQSWSWHTSGPRLRVKGHGHTHSVAQTPRFIHAQTERGGRDISQSDIIIHQISGSEIVSQSHLTPTSFDTSVCCKCCMLNHARARVVASSGLRTRDTGWCSRALQQVSSPGWVTHNVQRVSLLPLYIAWVSSHAHFP